MQFKKVLLEFRIANDMKVLDSQNVENLLDVCNLLNEYKEMFQIML